MQDGTVFDAPLGKKKEEVWLSSTARSSLAVRPSKFFGVFLK